MLWESCEPVRRIKRNLDGYISSRKAFVIVVIVMALLLYIGPNVFRWLQSKTPKLLGSSGECIEVQMYKYSQDLQHFDASISQSNSENDRLFYVGNGKIGLSIADNALYIYNKRSLSLQIDYFPIVFLEIPESRVHESSIVHFTNGIAYHFQCFTVRRVSLSVTHKFFASRTVPSLLIQYIEINNPSNSDVTILLKKSKVDNFKSEVLHEKQSYNEMFEYKLYSNLITIPDSSKVISLAIISPDLPKTITVNAKGFKVLTIRTLVHYSEPTTTPPHENVARKVKEFAQQEMKRVLDVTPTDLIRKHIDVWNEIWHSGFSISISKAKGALNGDTINATLYYVMSNTREYMSEWDTNRQYEQSLQKYLYNPDKCYGGHHTLQASTLWSSLKTVKEVNNIVSLWFLTLSKQGCQNLMKVGASGVMQAMVLSFGGFKFSNHHLEFDSDPKDLHRDYHFRRIIYGNSTHINISVIVQEDNKAIIYSALDRSDKDYYACDAGCLDTPIKLSSKLAQFPVKITQPLTAILYITSDKQHMEELKHTIHVKEVVEAPAHEHHIIALHRHGHKLGGLPAFFWVSIAFLIAVFHLFLIKLIYNEYCGNPEKSRKRYHV